MTISWSVVFAIVVMNVVLISIMSDDSTQIDWKQVFDSLPKLKQNPEPIIPEPQLSNISFMVLLMPFIFVGLIIALKIAQWNDYRKEKASQKNTKVVDK